MDYKYVTSRLAVKNLLAGKSIGRGWDNWGSQDIGYGWLDTFQGTSSGSPVVRCRVSVRYRALRSGQLGRSEWGTLQWIIKYSEYVMPDLLFLAASWAAP